MQNRVGVIDLGSNTFHLLIVDMVEGSFTTLYKERAFVGLAEKGIEKLSNKSMDKGAAALVQFKKSLSQYEVTQYSVLGTSALRSAKNSSTFITRIKKEVGFDIEIIDGNREAELIFKGVSQLLQKQTGCQVIMDVGGGSVEFIIVKNGALIWAESFDIGVGVLYNYLQLTDPVTSSENDKLSDFIESKLTSLKSVIKDENMASLIGASGSFEVVQSMNGDAISQSTITEVLLTDYHDIAQRIIKSTIEERKLIDGLPESRIKLIVVAMILINKAIEIIAPDKLLVSPYALKEGVLSELSSIQ